MREKGERATLFFLLPRNFQQQKIKYPHGGMAQREKGARATVFFLLPRNPQQQKIKYPHGERREKKDNKILSWLLALFSLQNNGNKKFTFYNQKSLNTMFHFHIIMWILFSYICN